MHCRFGPISSKADVQTAIRKERRAWSNNSAEPGPGVLQSYYVDMKNIYIFDWFLTCWSIFYQKCHLHTGKLIGKTLVKKKQVNFGQS